MNILNRFKSKRKNLDMDALRTMTASAVEAAKSRERQRVERLTLRVLGKIADGKFKIDEQGRLCVTMYRVSLHDADLVCRVLTHEHGFATAQTSNTLSGLGWEIQVRTS